MIEDFRCVMHRRCAVFALVTVLSASWCVNAEANPQRQRRKPAKAVKPAKVVKPVQRPAALRVHGSGKLRFVLSMPVGHRKVQFGNHSYYIHGGVYYQRHRHDGKWVYRIVSAPVGISVGSLPVKPRRTVIRGRTYYTDGTVYYVVSSPTRGVGTPAGAAQFDSQPQFKVVKPPIGAAVDSLPLEVTKRTSNGKSYFVANGVHYVAVAGGKSANYVVVEAPR